MLINGLLFFYIFGTKKLKSDKKIAKRNTIFGGVTFILLCLILTYLYFKGYDYQFNLIRWIIVLTVSFSLILIVGKNNNIKK